MGEKFFNSIQNCVSLSATCLGIPRREADLTQRLADWA